MANKPKFDPVITRVKLNPEQAVLECSCYGTGVAGTRTNRTVSSAVCYSNQKRTNYCQRATSASRS